MAIDVERTPILQAPNASRRQAWSIITTLLVAAIFLQAVFAGAMMSGFDWARTAHVLNAPLVTVAAFVMGITAIATLRRIPQGLKLGSILLALAAAMLVQTALGSLSAKGANLLWAHVPLGVILVALAGQAAAAARKLGEP